jgi:hypothetical protein
MAKQTFTTGQVLSAAQVNALQANDYNTTVSTKTASYVLVASDVGTTIVQNVATANTVTVNTGLFAAGDTLRIQNIGAGIATVTAGTATVNTANSLALPQWGSGILYFTAPSAAIFFPSAGAAAAAAATFSGFSGTNSGGINAPTSTFVAMTMSSEQYDTDAYHSTSTNTSRMTIPSGKSGKFLVTASIRYQGGAGSDHETRVAIYKNGSIFTFNKFFARGGGSEINILIDTVLDLAVADYLEIYVYQNSGIDRSFYIPTLEGQIQLSYLGA